MMLGRVQLQKGSSHSRCPRLGLFTCMMIDLMMKNLKSKSVNGVCVCLAWGMHLDHPTCLLAHPGKRHEKRKSKP